MVIDLKLTVDRHFITCSGKHVHMSRSFLPLSLPMFGLGPHSLVPSDLPSPSAHGHMPQEDFLRGKIKVNGKTGKLGNEISLQRDKNEITVSSDIPFSKRWVQEDC